MLEELELILEDAEDSMKKAIGHLEVELTKIRAGKATPFIAVFWGLLLNEKITFLQVISLGIILAGVYLANTNKNPFTKTVKS